MSRRPNIKLIVGLAAAAAIFYGLILFMTSQLTVSSQFADKADRSETPEATTSAATSPQTTRPETKQLEARLQADPDNLEIMSELAVAYSSEATETRNVGLLIRSVDLYQSILKADPNNSNATLSLALIMMDIGGYDRAAELFNGYLAQNPDDLRVRGDYALSLIQAEQLDEAEKQLQLIIDSKQFLVQSYLSRALIMKIRGNQDRVFAELDAAAAHAENDLDREKIAGFRAMLKTQGNAEPVAVAKTGSPAEQVQQYFQSHPIVGPKLKGIRWPSEKRAEVLLHDFPVEKMPPFAKAKFESSVNALLTSLGEGFSVVLLDADSNKELMHIPGDKKAAEMGVKPE